MSDCIYCNGDNNHVYRYVNNGCYQRSTLVPTPTIQACHVNCHWLICTAGLHLVMGTSLGATFGFPTHEVITGCFGIHLVHPIGLHCGLNDDGNPFTGVELGDGLRFNRGWIEGRIHKQMDQRVAPYVTHNGAQIRIVKDHECLVRPTLGHLCIGSDTNCAVIHCDLYVGSQAGSCTVVHFGQLCVDHCLANHIGYECAGVFAEGCGV